MMPLAMSHDGHRSMSAISAKTSAGGRLTVASMVTAIAISSARPAPV
jgi:hypothetical protein